jgi:hypothetical protein
MAKKCIQKVLLRGDGYRSGYNSDEALDLTKGLPRHRGIPGLPALPRASQTRVGDSINRESNSKERSYHVGESHSPKRGPP